MDGVATLIEIRPARPSDAAAIADVFIRSYDSLTFLPRVRTHDDRRGYVRDVLLVHQEVWVAEEEGRVIGFASLLGEELSQLYVDPDAQGRGAGGALLAKAKERRPGGLTFWVFQQNESARRFYEARGCRVVRLTDGRRNEEQTPDALYEWRPTRQAE